MLFRLLLRQYRRVYRISNWVQRHFTWSGQLVLSCMLGAAVFGVNTKQSTTYQLFVFLAVLVLLAWFNSRFNRLKVRFDRQVPRHAMVGESFNYRVSLTNLTGKPYYKLALGEQLAASFPEPAQLNEFFRLNKRPWYKRLTSYRHWLRYLRYQRGGTIAEVNVPELAQTTLQLNIRFTPNRRGVIGFEHSYLAKPDGLGLFRRLIALPARHSCLVLPKHYPLRPLPLAGRRKYQPGGVSLASSVGNSSEFMSLRDYRPGDALNTIHWKSFAKHGKLIVKEYEDEYFVRRALVLDTFIDGASLEQFEAAVSVAASVALSERQNEALLDFMFVGLESYCFTAGRGVDQLTHLQEILAGVQPCYTGDFERLQQAVSARAGLCSSLVCVLLHWDEARQDFIRQLRGLGLPLAVFLLHDGSLRKEQCDNAPEYFHLLDYHHLGEQLAAL